MSDLNPIRQTCTQALLVAGGLLALNAASHADESASTMPDEYEWSAELVAFDAAERTLTAQARVEHHAEIENLAEFDAGDRLTLTWTGRFSAAGIRDLSPTRETSPDRLTMPVEFVSSEMDGQYINFRVPVPPADVAAIETLSPGDWIRGTSPRQATEWSDAVSTIRPYNDVS